MNKKMWYKNPAEKWEDGLPIGNGRLAAMILGDPDCGRIALNHERLWRGKYRSRDVENNSDRLEEVMVLSPNIGELII